MEPVNISVSLKQNDSNTFQAIPGQQIDGSLFNQCFHEEKRKHSSPDIVSIFVQCCTFKSFNRPENNISVKQAHNKVWNEI